MDDCIATHMDAEILDRLAAMLIDEFREMKINRGRNHSFLGMEITINENKTISLDMRK